MRKGFTLIELLAVIVILAVILLITIPRVYNIVKISNEKGILISADRYINAIEKQILSINTIEEFNPSECKIKEDGNLICDTKEIVVDVDGVKPINGMIIVDNTNVTRALNLKYENIEKYVTKDGIDSEYVLTEEYIPIPNLMGNTLTPVVYDGVNWKIVNEKEKWYDYSKQEWANAVILTDEVKDTKQVGDIVTVEGQDSDVLGMFVWIPRYSYTIKYPYGVQLEGGSAPSQTTPGAIDIKFVDQNTKEKGNSTYTSGKPRGWLTHPAFTFGGEELSGIWIGKFETSCNKNVSFLCSDETCSNSDAIRILPNVSSLRSQKLSDMFYISRSMSRDDNIFGINQQMTNSHLIKNSEWGAAAYLSQSKYGKYGNNLYTNDNKEIYQNKSKNYITGMSNGTPSQLEYSQEQCKYNDINDRGEGKGSCGGGASTTGNISGIYDMSGGAYEYAMGYLSTAYTSVWGAGTDKNGNEVDSAKFAIKIDDKYFDSYIDTNSLNEQNKGHALDETAHWYSDGVSFPTLSEPWFDRGGIADNAKDGGIFRYGKWYGSGYSRDAFRIVLSPAK